MRNRLFGACVIATLFLLAAGTAVADVQIEFRGPEGQLLNDCTGTVYSTDGQVIAKFEEEPSGIYFLPIIPGDKVIIHAQDSRGSMVLEETAPPTGPIVVEVLGVPANDDCANAIALTVPADVLGSTTGATDDPNARANSCGTSVSNPSEGVWYTVAGTGNLLNISLANPGTNYDTKLHAFCADCDSLECLGGNDDAVGLQSALTVCSEAGADIAVFVHGFGSSDGNFQLTIEDTGAPCAPEISCLPPEPMGACCSCLNPPFNCSIETVSDCEAFGGTFQGDGSECFALGAVTTYSATPGAAIPDNNPGGLNSVISVAGGETVGDLDVDIEINHTWSGDLIITLTDPAGANTATLFNRFCGNTDNISATADDAGADVVCSPPISGSFNPESADGTPLSVFNGSLATGDWTLNVSDNAGADLGTLVSWALNITGQGDALCPDTSGGGDGGGSCPDDEDEDEDGDDPVDPPDDDDDDNSLPGGADDRTTGGTSLQERPLAGGGSSGNSPATPASTTASQELDATQPLNSGRKVERRSTVRQR